MAEHLSLDELRRRLRKDPASIVFAHLAEELRRAGRCREAVHVCRTGLEIHPEYVSARVTLGRALAALGQLDEAALELGMVRSVAPENLAAARALEEVEARRTGNESNAAPDPGPVAPVYSEAPAARESMIPSSDHLRLSRTVSALESWLAAIYVTRAERRA